MKKLLILILALALCFALAACGGGNSPCTEHVDKNNDGKCCFCGTDVAIVCEKHIDKELNGKCDVCEKIYVCDAHIDGDGDRICDKCGGVLGCKNAHTDANKDGNCDVCTKIVPKCDECVDLLDKYKREQPDCKCESCKADMVKTVKPCDSCTDEDADGTCDVCSANIKKDE